MAEEEKKGLFGRSKPAEAPAAPPVQEDVIVLEDKVEEPKKTVTIDASTLPGADTNGDGHIDDEEMAMYLEFKRKELEDADARRDAMRQMTWFALFGMLLYPFAIFLTSLFGLDKAANIIGDIAPTYFVAISALVAAYFGANAYTDKKGGDKPQGKAPPKK